MADEGLIWVAMATPIRGLRRKTGCNGIVEVAIRRQVVVASVLALPQRARLLAWLSAVVPCVLVWSQAEGRPEDSPISPGVSVVKGIPYRSEAQGRRLDLYLPISSGPVQLPRPSILAIHGGSWVGGGREDYGAQISRLATHGYVVAALDYSFARPGAPSWPGVMDDVREAVRWIRRHAEEYQIDPRRVAAIGSSSGGQLSSLLGTLPDEPGPDDVSSRVQAVVALYAPSDLIALTKERGLKQDPVKLFLGSDPSILRTEALAASPIWNITPDDAPMLLIHGSDDLWVRPEQSWRMAQALERVGVANRMIVVPGARHGFELVVRAPVNRDLLSEILAFLQNVWQVQVCMRP